MSADRTKDFRNPLGNCEHLRVFPHARRNRDDPADIGCPSAGDDVIEFGGKIGKIEVSMAVNKHHR